MSKVYSFRLSDDNPREAQAKEVIDTWVGEGYSLRYIVTEALNSISKDNGNGIGDELNKMMEYFEDMLSRIDVNQNNTNDLLEKPNLSDSFVVAVKNSAKSGFRFM